MPMTRVVLIGLLVGAGCAVRPPWPDPELTAGVAADVDGAIELTLDAAPVDVQLPAGDRLDLVQAVGDALRHSPDIQIALARVRAAQAQAHQARLLPNPVVSVVLRWPESGGSPVVEAGLAAELLSLVTRPGKVSAADDRLRGAGAEAVTVVLDVLAQVQASYVHVQALDALAPVLEERARLLAQMHEVAQGRLDAGEATRLEVTALEAQQVELEMEIAQQAMEQRQARLTLARLIGRPSDAAAWSVQAWEAPPSGVADEQAWLAAAMAHRPEIQAVQWELAALGVEARQAGLGWLDGGEGGVEAEREEGEWTVGPSVSAPLPIFDWGQARRREAQTQRLEGMHRLTGVRRQVIEEVRQAHAALLASQRACEQVRDRLVPLLDRCRQEAEAAYRAGQSDVLTVIRAQQDLEAGRVHLIDLQRQSAQSLIELHRAAGGPGHAPAPTGEETLP